MLNQNELARTPTNQGRKNSNKKGQALAEFIPVCISLIFVFSAALSYFEVMRDATLIQEMGRNLAFAKIANSGTLTSQADESYYMAQYGTFASNSAIGLGNECFTVLPRNFPYKHEVLKIFGLSANTAMQVGIFTKAVVYRRAGTRCQ